LKFQALFDLLLSLEVASRSSAFLLISSFTFLAERFFALQRSSAEGLHLAVQRHLYSNAPAIDLLPPKWRAQVPERVAKAPHGKTEITFPSLNSANPAPHVIRNLFPPIQKHGCLLPLCLVLRRWR